MTAPVVVQAAAIVNAVAWNGTRAAVFPAPTTPGNSVLFIAYMQNTNVLSAADAILSVTMPGATFQEKLNALIRYDEKLGLVAWWAPNITQAQTTITVTPANNTLNNYSALTALEIGTTASGDSWNIGVTKDTEGQVTSLSIGPAPASGSVSQVDTLAIAASMVNQSNGDNTNVGWQTPSGWTPLVASQDSSGAKRAIVVVSKQKTTNAAETVVLGSTNADLYGRSGLLILINGPIGAPAPSPPPPAPTPEPPPAPPPPGPAPAPSGSTFAFQFLNVDPAMAGQTGVTVQVLKAPTTEALVGPSIQSALNQEFVAAGEYSKLVIAHNGLVAVTLGESVRGIAQNSGNTAGFRGVIVGTVITGS